MKEKIIESRERINFFKESLEKLSSIESYSDDKDLVNSISQKLIQLFDGSWVSWHIKNTLKRDLVEYLKTKLIPTLLTREEDKLEIYLREFGKMAIEEVKKERLKDVLEKIRNGEGKLVGEGHWVKDAAYQVYKVDEKYFTIIVYDHDSHWLMDSTLKQITKDEIKNYI